MDLSIVRWMSTLHTPFLDRVMLAVTSLGDIGLIWGLTCLLLLAIPRTRKNGVICALALLLGFLFTNLLLKNLVARPRPFTLLPEIPLLLPPPRDWSFPSGHACSAVAVALGVWFWNKKWGAAALALAGLIILSRLYLTVHYPSDLLAGALVGAFCAVAARWLVGRWDAARTGRGTTDCQS